MTESDKELLEYAAKAAGLNFKNADDHMGVQLIDEHGNFFRYWHPLLDDGDALRLASRLNISIEFTHCLDDAPIVICKTYMGSEITEPHFPDAEKQLRLCITKAAAKHAEEFDEFNAY